MKMTCIAAALAALTALNAQAYDINSAADINVDANGLILRGFDATTYQSKSQPAGGTGEHTAAFEGAIYRFGSAVQREIFVASPGKFAPVFNGFCALAAAHGRKVDADPQAYRLIEGRLYVFASQGAAQAWDKDVLGNLAKADANWPRIRSKTPKELN